MLLLLMIGVFELASIQILPQELHHWHCFDEIDILISLLLISQSL
jgi:hypothetical protein